MKVKMKFDLGAIKNLALAHGEKLAFGVVGLVFLLLVWGAIKRPTLGDGNQPDQLREKARSVQTHVEQSTFDPKREGLSVVNYEQRATRQPVEIVKYDLPRPFDPLLSDPKTRRDNPQLFAVEDLRVGAGFGLFALKGEARAAAPPRAAPAAGERKLTRKPGTKLESAYEAQDNALVRGKAWAVITGLVPVRKQALEYARVFENAQGANRERDTPQYLHVHVERAEIDRAKPDKPVWTELKPGAFEAQFADIVADVVSATHTDPVLTSPLGPLVSGTWDAVVTHPKIPLIPTEVQPSSGATAGAPAAPVRATAANDLSKYTGRAAAPNPDMASTSAQAAPSGEPAAPEIEYRLLRIFDFEVESGKAYRYRVKATLRNPNYGVAAKYLNDPAAKPTEIIETAWSAPSPVAAVPNRYAVLAGGPGEHSRKSSQFEPSASLMITSLEPEEGVEATTQLEVWRGSVANTIAPKAFTINPQGGTINEVENRNFESHIVVVDISGGRSLSNKPKSTLASPVEVLVMDAEGNLRVRREVVDHSQVDARTPDIEEAEPKKDEKDKKTDDDPVPNPGADRSRRSKAKATPK